jgi:hypothetical protein
MLTFPPLFTREMSTDLPSHGTCANYPTTTALVYHL